jgi:dethiobiotin synthetase
VTRPARLAVITGTGTQVGKTWVAAGLLAALRGRNLAVVARKPAQSYALGEDTDAEVLARATGEPADTVCPANRSYPLPLAPPMAAQALDWRPPTLADLVDELDQGWPHHPVDIGVVEGVGGVASPLALDGDTASLARRIQADVAVLVGEPQLGIINSARLARLALGPMPVVVHLNRFEPSADLHRRNRDWLTGPDGFRVTTTLNALADIVVGASAEPTPTRSKTVKVPGSAPQSETPGSSPMTQ